MAKVELKQPIIDEISATIKDAASVIIVKYSGITVAQDTVFRKQLREAGVTYKVYKNTLMNRAFQGTEFEGLCENLKGTNAIAVSKDDATAPARIVSNFAKNCPALEIRAGVVEGVVYDAEGMKAIANIPSREELLSKFLGSIKSPITNFARVLNQIAEKGGASACEPAPAAEEAAAPVEEAAAEPVAEEAAAPAAEEPAAETAEAPAAE
ncbi:MAG: 50S ribosomal protein L10 [Lachnospiraceae bacterium]|nr:50S ribosomal protein L10 [Lachnospiraceae bacterium]